MIGSKSLKYFRLKNNFSQEKMSNLLGISQSSYNRLENDKREIKISDIKILAKNLSRNPEELFKELCGEEITEANKLFLDEIKEKYERLLEEKNAQIEILKSIISRKK